MKTRAALIGTAFWLQVITATATPTQQAPAPQRAVLQPEVTITTATGADLEKVLAKPPIQHRTEVSRSDRLTVIVSLQTCQMDTAGTCEASADLVVYKPDGSVHREMKGIDLADKRGTAKLAFTSEDAPGLYRIEAIVRDLRARRFGRTERSFAVK